MVSLKPIRRNSGSVCLVGHSRKITPVGVAQAILPAAPGLLPALVCVPGTRAGENAGSAATSGRATFFIAFDERDTLMSIGLYPARGFCNPRQLAPIENRRGRLETHQANCVRIGI